MAKNPGGRERFEIRGAKPEDAARLAELATQLGYPSSRDQVDRRLAEVLPNSDHAVLVAVENERVVGWGHAFVARVIESDRVAEVGGLVVDEEERGSGAGRLLMEHLEAWARTKSCRAVNVRSNIVRKDAHAFYHRLGYTQIKTQHLFRKPL